MRGGVVTRDERQNYTNFGFPQAQGLGYRQDGFGAQVGLDLGLAGARAG